MIPHIDLSIFKDISTNFHQITIGINDTVAGITETGDLYYIGKIWLLYNCEYETVILDAMMLLNNYNKKGIIDIDKTQSCKCEVHKLEEVALGENENDRIIIERDGQKYVNLNNAYLILVPYKKSWT